MATTPAAGKKRAVKPQRLDETPSSPVLVEAVITTKAKELAKAKAKMGRPTLYSDDLAYNICERIIEGDSLRTICKGDGMPSIATVFSWLDSKPDFLDKYTRAKDNQADTNTEDIQELAKQVIRGEVEPQAARVAIEAYKWTASKLKPKKYGDKLDLTSDGKAMPQPIISISAAPKTKELNS